MADLHCEYAHVHLRGVGRGVCVAGTYTIRVTAGDGTLSASAEFTLTVSAPGVNSAPNFGADSYTFNLAENADGSTTAVSVGTVAATDPDSGDTVSYRITAGNTGNRFSISSGGAITYTGSGEDFERFRNPASAYRLTVRAADDHAASPDATVTVTIQITDVNEAPSAPSVADRTAAAGRAFSYRFGSVDRPRGSDRDLRGASAFGHGRFLHLWRPTDVAELYREHQDVCLCSVGPGRVRGRYVRDSRESERRPDAALTASAEFTLTVPNRAPSFDEGSSTARSIAENTAADQNVGAPLAATDTDGDTLTWSLGGTDAASFQIVADSGQLQTKSGVTYDYETKRSYRLTVTVEDGNGGTDRIAVTVNLTDMNEAPVASTGGAVQAVASGATVRLDGSGSSDPDGDSLTYRWSKTSGPADHLERRNRRASELCRAGRSGDVRIRPHGTDPDGLSDTATVTLTVVAPDDDPPQANAGPDRTVTTGASVQLNGSGSTGEGLIYRWMQSSGTSVSLSEAAAPNRRSQRPTSRRRSCSNSP